MTDKMFMGASTKQGLDIANRSREIIRGLIGDDVKDLNPAERDIVERIVHSTADPEYAKLVKISPDFVDAAMTSLRNKETILTDINMVKYGITRYDGEVECYIKNEEVIEIAKKDQTDENNQVAFESGKQIIKLVEDDIKPSDIMTQEAFNNAIAVDMALGGSSNTALHIPALASEVDGVSVDLELFDEISRKVPHIALISPAGEDSMMDLHLAGGCIWKWAGHLHWLGPISLKNI